MKSIASSDQQTFGSSSNEIYLEQSAGNPQQVRSAGAMLDRMLGVLENLKRYGRNIPRSQ
jgi:hypothetical protein